MLAQNQPKIVINRMVKCGLSSFWKHICCLIKCWSLYTGSMLVILFRYVYSWYGFSSLKGKWMLCGGDGFVCVRFRLISHVLLHVLWMEQEKSALLCCLYCAYVIEAGNCLSSVSASRYVNVGKSSLVSVNRRFIHFTP